MMHKNRVFMSALVGLVVIANVGFAQVNAQPQGSLLQKLAIGVCVWLVTAVLAYVAWTLLKIIAKIGVVVLPILAGVAVALQLPDPITSDAVVAIAVPRVAMGVVASLVCYLYANLYDIEREVDEVEEQSEAREATPLPPKTSA
jgi:hypothetical protein